MYTSGSNAPVSDAANVVPHGVTTVADAWLVPASTDGTEIVVGATPVNEAEVLPNYTAVAPVKPVPVMVTGPPPP